MATAEYEALDVREKIAHIDQMLADVDRIYADRRRIDADHDRKQQQMRHATWLVAFSGMTAGAALFGGGAAIGALIVKLYFGG